MHSTKISGLAVDTEYNFHLVLRTSAGTRTSDKVTVRTHKMTDLSGITITVGIMPASIKENLTRAVERIGAKIVDGVRIDTTHFVTTEGRGTSWEKAVETNIPVVRPEWVNACEENGRILGVTKFYLDAMRPGPPSEDQLPPAPVPKDSPKRASAQSPVTQNGQKSGEGSSKSSSEPTNGKVDIKNSKSASENGSNSDGDDDNDGAPEQKSRAGQFREEQKVRLEDKEEQKVALRPSPLGQKDTGPPEEDEDEEGPDSKQASPADGASFQEVEL